MSSLTQISVPFHGAELYIVEHNGQPYTPMKPIVEGMGLDWGTQFRKLATNEKWGVVKMTIPTLGDLQEMICLPLRKIFAWLNSVSPNKIPNLDTRAKVITYQNECDDALWDYWTKGVAINSRATITPEQKSTLLAIVEQRAQGQRKTFAEMWSRHNRHFNINSYHELLAVRFHEACDYLKTMEIRQKIAPVAPTVVEPTTLSDMGKLISTWTGLYCVNWEKHGQAYADRLMKQVIESTVQAWQVRFS